MPYGKNVLIPACTECCMTDSGAVGDAQAQAVIFRYYDTFGITHMHIHEVRYQQYLNETVHPYLNLPV